VFYGFILLLLAGAVFLFISPVRIWIDYRHRGKAEDSLLVQLRFLWGLSSFSLQVPVISATVRGVTIEAEAGKRKERIGLKPSPGWLRQSLRTLKFLRVRKILNFFRRSLTIRRLVWHTEIGMRDCARLAQLSGALWAAKGMAGAWLQSLLRAERPPVFRVLPHFNRSHFRTVFTCILEFPLGYAIIASFWALYAMLKFKLTKRGGENVRTSNSRADENGHGEHQGNGGCQYGNR
jgi:hypothetical protein